MTTKRILLFIVAFLAVSVSLYSALKPAPVVKSEQLTLVTGEQGKAAEAFALKLLDLSKKRSLYGLKKVSCAEASFFFEKSIKDLKAFDRKGGKVENVYNTQKEPFVYTCTVSNDANQQGKMMLKSLNGKKWAFIGFMIDKQESKD